MDDTKLEVQWLNGIGIVPYHQAEWDRTIEMCQRSLKTLLAVLQLADGHSTRPMGLPQR